MPLPLHSAPWMGMGGGYGLRLHGLKDGPNYGARVSRAVGGGCQSSRSPPRQGHASARAGGLTSGGYPMQPEKRALGFNPEGFGAGQRIPDSEGQ